MGLNDRKRWEDLIFQEMEEKALILKQVEARGRIEIEGLVQWLIEERARRGKPLTVDEARARVMRALETD